MPICPVGAITKRGEDGIVIVESEKCLGNVECDSKCLKACPYDAPQFSNEFGGKMTKCNFCIDRYHEKKVPICVEACRTRALDAGHISDLKKKYGDSKDADNFIFSERTKPSIIFKPKLK